MGGAAAWAIVAAHSTSKTNKQTIRVRMSGLLRANSICQVSLLGSQFVEPSFPDGSGVLREKRHNSMANGAGTVETSPSRMRKNSIGIEPSTIKLSCFHNTT